MAGWFDENAPTNGPTYGDVVRDALRTGNTGSIGITGGMNIGAGGVTDAPFSWGNTASALGNAGVAALQASGQSPMRPGAEPDFAPYAGTFTGGGAYPLASVMGSGLMQPWTTPFNAPRGTDDPGWQFRLNESVKALDKGAAAKGTLLTGGAAKALARYTSDLASQEYGNAWNRAKNQYDTAYQIFSNNQNTQYNRLAGLAGTGQNAANALGSAASGYGANAGNIMTGIGNAQAAGQAASGAAWSGAMNNLGNTMSGYAMMYPYLNPALPTVPSNPAFAPGNMPLTPIPQ